MQQHSAEYRRIITERRIRDRQRRYRIRLAFLSCGLVAAILVVALFIIKLLINGEHNKAVKQYNDNNWTEVKQISGGKSVHGMIEGEEFAYLDNGRYYGGIYVDGVSIEGLTYDEAREKLIKAVEDKLNSINMVVTVGDASLALSANDFNISVDVNDILKEAYSLGRESINDYVSNYKKQQDMIKNPVNYSIEYKCDRERIKERVSAIADFVNTEPLEPYITVSQRPSANTDAISSQDDTPIIKDTDTIVETVYAENGTAIAYIYYNPGKNGFVMNQESMVDRIFDAFDKGDFDCVISAELEDTAPQKTASDIKGSIKKITSYTSKFDTNKSNRSRNVQKAAGILNGCVVKPWQEISFNTYIGPRTEAGGWLRAPGITGGREYEDSPGGGICQVSGTLYNALLQCGPNKIKVTQRQHHSWPSEYVPYGLDATVDTNGPDLKWKNISSDNLYIFTYADMKTGTMHVYVYGVPEPDGSYYETFAETVETIQPPESKTVKQPLWPTGYRKETIRSRVGYTAKAYLKHFDKNGELIETKYLYTDTYAPVQGEITIGTGPASLPRPTT
ncbi:MAG: VanW family protein [Clostridia bacterium]|nr:VanW family protein [Clostridia bacterium]